MAHFAERFLFGSPTFYKAKRFVIEKVLWRWVLSGAFGLQPHPMPDLHELFRGKRVLVAACGPGDVSTGPPCDAAKEVVAFDISSEFVESCKRNRPSWTVFKGDIEEIPYADGAFEVAVIYSSLHHIPINAERVLGELARVTRGQILIVEGVVPERGPLRRALLAWWALVDGGVHYYTRRELEAVMGKLGLVPEQLSQHGPIDHMMLAVLRSPGRARTSTAATS